MVLFKVKTHLVGGLVARPMRRVWRPWRSWVRPPWTLNKFFQTITNKEVPHGSPGLVHVEPSHSTNKCHMSHSQLTTCICPFNTCPCQLSVQSMLYVVRSCHVLYGCATFRMTVPRVTLAVVTRVTT